MIEITIEARIICDGCGVAAIIDSPDRVREVAKEHGWAQFFPSNTNEKNYWYCTRCGRDTELGRAEGVIESIREWCERGHYHPSDLSDWQKGFLTARREVRAILDGDQ